MKRLLLVPVLLLALAACGEDADEIAEAPAPVPAPVTSVTVTSTVGGTASTVTLECGPTGGTHPDPEAACTALLAPTAPLAPPPADQVCTEIYGGPETARVVGTVQGRAVDRSFDRANGCGIADWTAMGAVLPEPAGGPTP